MQNVSATGIASRFVHPIERLRYVARAEGAGPTLLAREAARALIAIADEPAGLVTGCRRLIDRHTSAGPLWWLSARMLCAGEPITEGWLAADELDDDPTPGVLAAALPDDASVLVVGWPEQVGDALGRRADLDVFVVDLAGLGSSFARRLSHLGCDATVVPDTGVGAAVAEVDLVLLEALALGPSGFAAASGSRAAAAVAAHLGKGAWVVAGVGRVLPERLWEALAGRLEADGDPWECDEEIVPLDLATAVFGPSGPQDPQAALERADCPTAPELLRSPSHG